MHGHDHAVCDGLAGACDAETYRAVVELLVCECQQLARTHELDELGRTDAPEDARAAILTSECLQHFIEQHDPRHDRHTGEVPDERRMLRTDGKGGNRDHAPPPPPSPI